jgi:hypothetical protein
MQCIEKSIIKVLSFTLGWIWCPIQSIPLPTLLPWPPPNNNMIERSGGGNTTTEFSRMMIYYTTHMSDLGMFHQNGSLGFGVWLHQKAKIIVVMKDGPPSLPVPHEGSTIYKFYPKT